VCLPNRVSADELSRHAVGREGNDDGGDFNYMHEYTFL
jgi:hypothetical protein